MSGEPATSQKKYDESVREAREYLEKRGEVFLSIPVSEKEPISRLSKIISIDGFTNDYFRVYASPKGFDSLISNNIAFRVEIPPSIKSGTLKTTGEFPGDWTRYPSWDEYVSFLQKLASSNPELCRLDTIGFSIEKRAILALKISDQVKNNEPEPCFLFTSTMHGNEVGGFFLLLRFADWLAQDYGKDPHITDLVNDLQIWINPLSNPDGTYFISNASISGAKRFNINNVDLNRNFPDPQDGPHPDGEEYQPETLAMMKFMESHGFTLSANLHGGAELVNYPWDTWAKFHADDDWYRLISRQYADTAHKLSKLYMTDMVNGITNGYAWYEINGGRQDYVNYFLRGREVTLELSRDYIPLPDTLAWFWECNRRSLLNYMEQTIFGITGTVTDRMNGRPVRAEIVIPGHDSLNSSIWSDSISGKFYRLIKGGFYDLKIVASGFKDTVIYAVSAADFKSTAIDIHLTPIKSGVERLREPAIKITNPFTDELKIYFDSVVQEEITICLYDIMGRNVINPYIVSPVANENIITINCKSLHIGIYILKIYTPEIGWSGLVVKTE